MSHGELLPTEVATAVESVLGEMTVVGPLSGGVQDGALRVRAGEMDRVVKFAPIAHPNHLAGWERARRVMTGLKSIGYPAPAWLGLGATERYVWQVLEFLPGRPAELTDEMVDAVMDAVELQAGRADGPDNWSGFVHQVGTGRHPEFTHLPSYSAEVADLVALLVADSAGSEELGAPDVVHGDLSGGNLLFLGTRLTGIVDSNSAAAGHRAIDLTTLMWYTFTPGAEAARRRLRSRIIDLVGWSGAAVLLSSLVQQMLAFPLARGRHAIVAGVVARAHQARGELHSAR